MAIRKSTENEFKKALKNYNAKLSRLRKADVSVGLPEKATLSEIKSRSAKDVRKEIERLKRFTQRGAETAVDFQGLQITKFERQEISNQLRSVNIKRTIRRKKGDLDNTNKKTIPKFRNKTALKKFQKSIEIESRFDFEKLRAEKYVDNYLTAIGNIFGSEATELFNIIQELEPEKFVQFGTERDLLSISFIYDPQERERKLSAITQEWQRAIE